MLEALAKEVFLKYLLSQFCTLIIIFHDKAEESGMIFKFHLQFTVSLHYPLLSLAHRIR